jgi:hypothetical protein
MPTSIARYTTIGWEEEEESNFEGLDEHAWTCAYIFKSRHNG